MLCIYIYIHTRYFEGYIYIYIHTHTHTHTHVCVLIQCWLHVTVLYIYIYIYIYRHNSYIYIYSLQSSKNSNAVLYKQHQIFPLWRNSPARAYATSLLICIDNAYSDTPHSVGFSVRGIGLSQIPLPDNTQYK